MQQGPVGSDRAPSSTLVSIVIPTLNRPDYLRAALASVVAQSHRNLEIVVQDNASAADPAAVVESFDDPRISYFRNATRMNQTENMVSACMKARGRYIAVLCDDDLWHPDFVRDLVAPLEVDSDIVISFCDHYIIDSAGRVDDAVTAKVTRTFQRHRLARGIHRPFDDIAIVYRSIPGVSAAVLRRDVIAWDEIPLDMPYGLDLYLAYVAARTQKACYYEPRRLAQLRYHAGSVTSASRRTEQKLANARTARAYWAKFARDGEIGRNRRYFEMKAGQNAALIALVLFQCGKFREALGEVRRSWAAGLIRPSMLLSHLVYAIRLRRVRA
jgi:glycosyltransferase involved in cell wall biosynthesis